jgi:long-chain acyl-CoA synthetase
MVINEGFGMTEVGVVTMNPPSGVTKVGSVGRAAPGVHLSIRAKDGREVPAGTEGRLWVSSPSLTMGYWGDPAATAAVIRDGWLDSGDHESG